MAKDLRFYIVDVFAEQEFAGNQLAVFINAGNVPAKAMQKIARETNFSETTFIRSDKENNGGWDVRIFTPEEEVPFAGHPTLGSAYVIQQMLMRRKVNEVKLNLKVGQIPVQFKYLGKTPGILWMKQNTPVFGKYFDALRIAKALGIKPAAIDRRFPVQEVSTGLPFIIAPLKNLDAVKKAMMNIGDFKTLIKGAKARCILVLCPQTYSKQNDLNVRVFAPFYGVPEDPATGSANGCLAGYLVKNRYFGTDVISVKVEQGYEIGRRSRLYLKARNIKGKIEVLVGGKVRLVAEGTFL
ncbi:MAG TPA: PhzF family phenazine biosynthesis protein [bacterium]